MDSTDFPTSILITVDVEDWFQVENLRPVYPLGTWNSCDIRVERNTIKLLDLFDSQGVQATFFVLGWIAERCPHLVEEISQRGHEVASHGYQHQLCSELSRRDLYEDVYRSKALLEDIIGRSVSGYRAPSFSITRPLLEVLKEAGYCYDSSYNSFTYNNRYGRANGLFSISTQGCLTSMTGIVELPVSNLKFAGQVIPWGGGGYFRFWPLSLYLWGVTKAMRTGLPFVFYCHPWEIDPQQPRVGAIGPVSSFRHYLRLSKTEYRLGLFLSQFNNSWRTSCSTFISSCSGHDKSQPTGFESKPRAETVPIYENESPF
jgi:polysaccharide deacetylase family protein (PEP-CTERM system associated)